MRIKVSRSKNSESYFVIKDIYRDNKRTSKVVEALGNRREIQEKHPGIDPLEWAKKYAKKLTEEEKQKNAKIIAKYYPYKTFPKKKQRCFNIGYLFLQSIYHELKIDKVCHQISTRHGFSFDLNTILSRLIYIRVLHPTSKKGTDRKSTRLNSSHVAISYAVFCLKKK